MKERLTPRERFALLVIDEKPDHCPVIPLLTSFSAKVAGMKLKEYYTKGKALAQAQIIAWEEFGHDAINIFSEVGIIAEALGSEFFYPEDDLPVLKTPALNRKEIKELKIPDPYTAGRLPLYLEAIEFAYQAFGDQVPILAYLPAPLTTAMFLTPPEEFLINTIRNPSLVRDLLAISLQGAIAFSSAIIDAGGLPIIVDPLASASVISPKAFQEFALPYERELINFLHRYDLDCILHICGDTEPILDFLPETNADLISLDKVPISLICQRLGKKMRIIGNFPPTNLIFSSPKTIEEEVKEMVKIGRKAEKGYIAATGCEVPMKTPKENLKAFIRGAKEAGWY